MVKLQLKILIINNNSGKTISDIYKYKTVNLGK